MVQKIIVDTKKIQNNKFLQKQTKINKISNKRKEYMKKISTSLYFTVLWKGICQMLGWFFGLFGYKRDGKFAKCVWGLFATSGAIVMAFFALVIICAGGEVVYERFFKGHQCDDDYCFHSEYINRDIYFHNTEDGKGYIYNKRTGEKLIKHIAWIAKPLGKDTLVCFSNGKKRGYFSKNTGKVVIEPKYDHAWVFSDGLASVEMNGFIKFIDGNGKTVIDQKMPYIHNMEGYVFHSGYCVVDSDDGELCGLIDKTGKIVLAKEFNSISPTNDLEMWRITKGKENGLLNKDLKPIIPLTECTLWVCDNMVDLTMPDHTMRKFDLQGNLINDFYIAGVRTLEYTKDEVLYRSDKSTDDEGNVIDTTIESYHPVATSRMRAYVAGDGYEGLMNADGHIVTMPLYKDISAIGYDLYLCEVSNSDHVVVNGKGEIIK